MSKIAFLGGGSFGTSLSVLLAEKEYDISIFDRNKDTVTEINEKRTNSKYLKDTVIPKNVNAYFKIEEAIEGASLIVLSVPSHAVREIAHNLKGKIEKDIPIVSIAKGIEQGTNLRLSKVIKEELPNPVVILSGPSHAEEVAMKIPTTVVVSSEDMKYAKIVQDIFMNGRFRVYTNEDIVGVEIGGAIKNIIALAAGICDGLGFGDNTKAALMTRGMSEIVRVGVKLGGKPETFLGLTGMGDLIVTCTSQHSRNRMAGYLIGKGMSEQEAVDKIGMVVEGIKACRAFYELNKEIQVEMPITTTLYEVLIGRIKASETVNILMGRDKKEEIYY